MNERKISMFIIIFIMIVVSIIGCSILPPTQTPTSISTFSPTSTCTVIFTVTETNTSIEMVAIRSTAAALASAVVDGEYLHGGQGYHWERGSDECKSAQPYQGFLSPPQILTENYCYYLTTAPDFYTTGMGLDCSGLVYWSYHIAANSFDHWINNKASGTPDYWNGPMQCQRPDYMATYNSVEINVENLQPGDLLFFNLVPNYPNHDEEIDHVAMYVGGNGDCEGVVEAVNTNKGIIYTSFSTISALYATHGTPMYRRVIWPSYCPTFTPTPVIP